MTEPTDYPSDEAMVRWRADAESGGLPSPHGSRWRPLRAGVVNLWEFDVTEYWLADGRAQFVGQNESGKSSLMALTSLIMLAGDLNRALVDTFGEQHKAFRYYVEPTNNPKDRRSTEASASRGWSWVEYGRETPEGPRYFTLLLFAEAKRSVTDLNPVWATAEGEQRVRAGIELHLGNAVKLPREVAEIDIAHDPTEYRQRLATRLWGFSSADRLDAVVRILKVLRIPNLGQRLDPGFFVRMMREALPEIDREETDQLAEGWDQLDRLAADRDEAQAALDAVHRFVRLAWNPWADRVIRLYADALTTANRKFDDITTNERLARGTLTTAQQAADGLTTTLADVRESVRDAETRYEEHLRSPQFISAQGAVMEANRLRDAAEQASRAERRAAVVLGAAKEQRDRRVGDRDEADGHRKTSDEAARTAAEVVTAAAASGRFPEAFAEWGAAYDLLRLDTAVRERQQAVGAVRKLLGTHRAAASTLERSTEALSRAEQELRVRTAAQEEASTAVDSELQALSDHLEGWAAGLVEPPQAELRVAWVAADSEMSRGPQPRAVLTELISAGWLRPLTWPLRDQAVVEERQARQLRLAAEADERDAAEVEAETTPEPVAPLRWSRRTRPTPGPDGAPLWQLVDPVADLAPAVLDHLEAALDAMGLLDAWVSPDGLWRADRDGAEIVLTPPRNTAPLTPPPLNEEGAGRTLALGLQLAHPDHPLSTTVTSVLAAITYEVGPDVASGADDSGYALTATGRWRTPLAAGRAEPGDHGAELIGATARAAARARRTAELRAAAAEKRARAAAAEARGAELRDRVEALDLAAVQAGSDAAIVRAALALQAADKEYDLAQRRHGEVAERHRAAEIREQDARTALLEGAATRRLPSDEGELDVVEAAVRATTEKIGRLSTAVAALTAADRALAGATDRLAEAVVVVTGAESAHLEAARDARDARLKADEAARRLAQPDRDLLEEEKRLKERRASLRLESEELAERLSKQQTAVTRALDVLDQTSAAREQAAGDRERALAGWSRPVAAGLAAARDLDTSSGSLLTHALGQAREAKTRFEPPGWPDGDAAKQQEVERTWNRLAGSALVELRQSLEESGGRTVTIADREEGDDGPGGGLPAVLIRVDAMGDLLEPVPAVAALARQVTDLAALHDQQLQEMLVELLESTFVEHLRFQLGEVIALLREVNRVLAAHPTGTTRTILRLRRLAAPGHEDGFEVLNALEGSVVEGRVREQIRSFLEQRIRLAQEEGRVESVDWKDRLAELLDYRRWFWVQTEYRVPDNPRIERTAGLGSPNRPRQPWQPLTKEVHGQDSGGGKSITLLQPLLATLVALYSEAPDGPRPLWLDEAFTGVDDKNRPMMLDLLVDFRLDFLVAGPDTLITVQQVPTAAIWYVTRAAEPLAGVELSVSLWAGKTLTPVKFPTYGPDPSPDGQRSTDPGTDSLFDGDSD